MLRVIGPAWPSFHGFFGIPHQVFSCCVGDNYALLIPSPLAPGRHNDTVPPLEKRPESGLNPSGSMPPASFPALPPIAVAFLPSAFAASSSPPFFFQPVPLFQVSLLMMTSLFFCTPTGMETLYTSTTGSRERPQCGFGQNLLTPRFPIVHFFFFPPLVVFSGDTFVSLCPLEFIYHLYDIILSSSWLHDSPLSPFFALTPLPPFFPPPGVATTARWQTFHPFFYFPPPLLLCQCQVHFLACFSFPTVPPQAFPRSNPFVVSPPAARSGQQKTLLHPRGFSGWRNASFTGVGGLGWSCCQRLRPVPPRFNMKMFAQGHFVPLHL